MNTKRKRGSSIIDQPSVLYICRSCVWSEAKREQNGQRQGEKLLTSIKKLIIGKPLVRGTSVRGVFCLNGCKNPCNIALRSPGKHGLRYSGLSASNGKDVLALLNCYKNSKSGNEKEMRVPKSMQGKLSVCTPPPPIREK